MRNNLLQATEIVWHYTKAEFLSAIEHSGELQPKAESDSNKEGIKQGLHASIVPLIWFSSDQQWEPLCVQLSAGLNRHGMTWQKLAAEQTAIRFGIPSNDPRLLDWKASCIVSSSNRGERRLMEKLVIKGKKAGADVNKWFTSPTPIPLKDLSFQVWWGGQWMDHIR